MDQAVRNKLRSAVTQCRKALEDATAQALQGHFGIYAARKKGEVHVEEMSRMGHLADEDRACRQDLIEHLNHIQAIGRTPREALDQLIREIAFTHLNRLCAYKMMEARGLIREAVSRGMKSQGFSFYLADHPDDERLHNAGQQDVAYRHFLDWLGGTLSEEIGVLFNPNDPANRIYPPHRVLDEVLALVNGEDLNGIWTEDETIGWVYQYFTPKELRDQARKGSKAPRNSYELAFRNQFFTPRYVVEFLTDNTLGRIWYEMRKGETTLKDRCRYLVLRPKEIFLKDGEEPPAGAKTSHDDLSQEELLQQPVYIQHRPKKDPREIRVLDPACGSGHFLLYCFDLLQDIYEEAYADPDLSPALKKDYPTVNDLRRAVPGLILKHNLHGIDIDLRATQIAALALWLRCQRAYQDLTLPNGERPKITRSNVVCAEPMPGETDLLKEFTATLQPKVLGQLVEVVFEKMKLAGEAGSLLRIEEEIQDAVATAKKEYQAEMRRRKDEIGYLPGLAPPREATLFDFADMTDAAFLDRAEEEIVAALRWYAEQSANGRAFTRRLFAEEAARGFAFIDNCRKRFDVVLMNPPFGELSQNSKEYVEATFPSSKGNILAHFLERATGWTNTDGKVAAIVSRTCFFLTSMCEFRTAVLGKSLHVEAFADLGSGVLDAMVETSAAIFGRRPPHDANAVFVRLLCSERKDVDLLTNVISCANGRHSTDVFVIAPTTFAILQGTPYVYWVTPRIIRRIAGHPTLEPTGCDIRVGLQTGDDFRFLRLWYEVVQEQILGVIESSQAKASPQAWIDATKKGKVWAWYSKIDEASPFAASIHLVVNWGWDGREIKAAHVQKGDSISRYVRSESSYFKPGVSYMLRSSRLVPYVVPMAVIPTAGRSQIYPKEGREQWVLALTASNVASAVARFRGENFGQPKFQNSMVASIPYIEQPDAIANALRDKLQTIIESQKATFGSTETCIEFVVLPSESACRKNERLDRSSLLGRSFDLAVGAALGLDESEMKILERDLMDSVSRPGWVGDDGGGNDEDEEEEEQREPTHGDESEARVSYAVGSAVGRWDVRFATGERERPELNNPFSPLPVCPPGMLQGGGGLPARSEDVPSEYSLRINWDGILVDDPEHKDDIVHRVRDVFEVIWKERAEAVEKEAREILGVRELRDYFRKPGNGGFWMDHVKRYSKSRRKAPIYWYLRSAKGNYGLWLYYHRLDKDILFKALLNYVEPKIRLEEDRLKTLRSRKEAAGTSGREAKQVEKEMDQQEQFVSELHDFKAKLRRAADLHLTPDRNDGVVLNIAPLWELVPWKEAKRYWEELCEGKYEWSSIGTQLREKELVRT